MNLTESVKHVLRKESHGLLTGFWKDDLREAFGDLKTDFKKFISHRRAKKGSILKHLHLKDSATETLHVIEEIPGRIRDGFNIFKDQFIKELDQLEDPREKAVFSLKVLGALTSFGAGLVYDFRRRGAMVHLPGLKKKTALTDFLLTELVIRLSQLFILRFVSEIEGHLSDEEDLRRLRFLKQMVSGGQLPDEQESGGGGTPEDPAIELVEKFKNYIMTGKES